MKATKLELKRLKKTADFENIQLTLEVELTSKDKPDTIWDEMELFADYKLNKEDRDAKYAKYVLELENPDITEKRKEQLEKYIKTYKDYMEKVCNMEYFVVS